MAITHRDLLRTASEQEKLVFNTFREIIQGIRDQTSIQEVVRLLEVGNVEGVINLLQLDAATFEPLQNAIREAYRTGGLTGAEQVGRIPVNDGTMVMRFNVRAPAAEAWLADMSSRMLVDVVEQQRAMTRTVLTNNLAKGNNPRTAALDLVGRIDTVTKKRTGGFIGLADNQAQWAATVRDDLEVLNPNYLTKKLRDRRFDATVRKAIEEGKPLKQSQVDAMVTRYQARAERYRGEVIARTESINALRSGQHEAIDQAIELGDVDDRDMLREWDSSGDSKTREDHRQMEGQKRAHGVPFQAPDGSLLMYPGDSSLGATAAQTIQCRCRENVTIDFGKQLKRIEGFA